MITLLLYGCKSNTVIVYEMPDFKETFELKAEVINDSYLFQYAQNALIYDSLLFFTDKSQENTVHIFNRNTGDFIKSFAAKGKGPGEIITLSSISIDKNSESIKVNDQVSKTIMSYDIKELINNQEIYCHSFSISDEAVNGNFLRFIKDSLYLTTGFFDHILLTNGRKTITIYNNPVIDNTIFKDGKEWSKFMQNAVGRASLDGYRYVEGSLYGGIMNIYDIYSDHIQQKVMKNFFKPIFDDEQRVTSETIFGFCSFDVSDRYIYALIHAKTNPTTMPNTIWKFDWEGQPIAKYNCDYCIESFAVLEDEGMIYASVYTEDFRQVIAKFTL